MRASKIIIVVVIGAILLFGIAFLIVPLLSSHYLRFMGKDTAYYTEVAHACDLIMQQHPVSSNDTITLYSHMVLPYTMKLSGRDTSLPKIIRALHPDMILVSTNRVWIEIPPERMGGFVITWERDDMRTNYWALQSNGDGLVKTVYEESRP
jgi:hypothetical protein